MVWMLGKREFSSMYQAQDSDKTKGAKIVRILKSHKESDSPQFRHWIKQFSAKLKSHSSLELNVVLCLPARKKVCECIAIFIGQRRYGK